MDSSYRRSLARPARSIWRIPNCASTLPELGALRGTGASAARGSPGLKGPRRFRPEGVLHRRNIRSGEKRGRCVGKTKRGKGSKLMAVADRHGLPLAICAESASPAEVKLVAQTLEQRFIAEVPEKIVGDKAYDSDALDRQVLEQFGAEMIAPHRRGRRPERKTQDGRPLRRFKRRWKAERLFAWLYNFRRLVVRYEYHVENYVGLVQLACVIILLRYL